MISSYIIFVVPVLLSLAITPLVISYARLVGAIDLPNERKVHKNPIPRLGGVAIYISFFVSFALAVFSWWRRSPSCSFSASGTTSAR
jgi:UDP-N-acetylmuramyl pentapeptide phosphotransferase/UDP-N-acetylglucosamine-1-phosphate transferase